jgi:hypothetical protein
MNFGITNKNYTTNKGSVAFVFYFIIAIALLALAAYYVGINEQKKLFKSITDKKQQDYDRDVNGDPVEREIGALSTSIEQNIIIKSLIDSPNVVLRNLQSGRSASSIGNSSTDSSVVVNGTSTAVGPNVDVNSVDLPAISNSAKKAEYFVKSSDNKKGTDVKLINGTATGDNCYTAQGGRVCFPLYKLEKIWSIGDVNSDGASDAVVSVSAEENVLQKKPVVSNFYALISKVPVIASTSAPVKKSAGKDTSVKNVTSKGTSSASTSTVLFASSTISASSSTPEVLYVVTPFNYGVNPPNILSADIIDGNIILLGNFYSNSDAVGSPSLNKVVRYKVGEDDSVNKIGEATLFSEQKENTANWYLHNYEADNLSFSFKTPETWKRVENFDKGVKINFTELGGRGITLETSSMVETCAEFEFNLKDVANINIKSSQFIDLGQFGVGLYLKYAIDGGERGKQYHADICVTDKSGDKKVFSLYSTTKEDEIPYFSIFDKIWSTFKVQ